MASNIAHAGQRDFYSFTLAQAKRIVVDSQTNSGSFNWSLLGPRGTVTSGRSFQNTDSIDGTSIYDLVAGDYTLEIDGINDATEIYSGY